MKSRTSTSAPGAGLGVLAVAREPAAGGQVAAPLPGGEDRVRVDRVAVAGVDLEVDVRRRRLRVAGVADEAEQRARLDPPAADRLGREGGEVRVEEAVAAVGLEPQPVAGDRQRADAVSRPSATASTGLPNGAKQSLPWCGPISRGPPKSSAHADVAVDGEDETAAREALRGRDPRLRRLARLRVVPAAGRGERVRRRGRRRRRLGLRRRVGVGARDRLGGDRGDLHRGPGGESGDRAGEPDASGRRPRR